MCDNPTDFIHKSSKYLDSAQTFQLFEKDALPCQSFKTSRHCPWPLPALCTTALFTSKGPSDKIPSQRSTPPSSPRPLIPFSTTFAVLVTKSWGGHDAITSWSLRLDFCVSLVCIDGKCRGRLWLESGWSFRRSPYLAIRDSIWDLSDAH